MWDTKMGCMPSIGCCGFRCIRCLPHKLSLCCCSIMQPSHAIPVGRITLYHELSVTVKQRMHSAGIWCDFRWQRICQQQVCGCCRGVHAGDLDAALLKQLPGHVNWAATKSEKNFKEFFQVGAARHVTLSKVIGATLQQRHVFLMLAIDSEHLSVTYALQTCVTEMIGGPCQCCILASCQQSRWHARLHVWHRCV